MKEEETKEEEIYGLLSSGWIYCESDPYFDDVFFSHLKEKKRFGNGYFVKKSKILFDMLVNFGMLKDSSSYDSCVVMFLTKKGMQVTLSLMSLKETGPRGEEELRKVSRDIMLKKDHLAG